MLILQASAFRNLQAHMLGPPRTFPVSPHSVPLTWPPRSSSTSNSPRHFGEEVTSPCEHCTGENLSLLSSFPWFPAYVAGEHLREDGKQEPRDIPTQPLLVTLEDGVRQDTLSLSSGCEGPCVSLIQTCFPEPFCVFIKKPLEREWYETTPPSPIPYPLVEVRGPHPWGRISLPGLG